MLKSQLIELLNSIEGDIPVLIARDEEGNGFRHLQDIDVSDFYEDRHEIAVLHPDDVEQYVEDDFNVEKAIVFWP